MKSLSSIVFSVFLLFLSLLFSSLFQPQAFSGIRELRYLTSNYLAFAESQLAQYQFNPVFESTRQSCPDTLESYQRKVEVAADLRDQFLVLAELQDTYSDPFDPEFLKQVATEFKYFLIQRLSWLEHRQEDYHEFQKKIPLLNAGIPTRIGYVHTSPEEVKKYPQGSLYHEIAYMTLMDYRILNRILRELFEILPASQIDGETEQLLRISASLHSFLGRKTEDPGFPELGFLLNTRSEKTRNTSGDLVYYYGYLGKSQYWVKDIMLGAPEGKRNLLWLTQEEAFELRAVDRRAKKVEAPYPLPSVEQLLAPKILEEVKAEALRHPVPIAVDSEAEPVSPSPPIALSTMPSAPRVEQIPERVVLIESVVQSGSPLIVEHERQDHDEQGLDSKDAQEKEEEKKEKPSELVGSSEKENLEAELDQESEIRRRARPAQSGVKAEAKFRGPAVPKQRAKVAAPAPRFRRVFHSQQKPTAPRPADLKLLSATQHGWVSDLFHHRLKVVRYRDFKSVWLSLKGKVRSETEHGGSHFDLRDSEDRWVGGIFANNEGQEYSKHYHPVLRDALTMIGITKELFK